MNEEEGSRVSAKDTLARLIWFFSVILGWLTAPKAQQLVLAARNFELLHEDEYYVAVGLLGIVVAAVLNAVILPLTRVFCLRNWPLWNRTPLYLAFAVANFGMPAVAALAVLAVDGLPYGMWANPPV